MNYYLILSLTLSFTSTILSVVAAYHALMTKRDSRAALAWVAFSLFIPFAGPIVYLLFGINRISRAAQASFQGSVREDPSEAIREPEGGNLRPLSQVGESITGMGLRSCDEIEVLENGEASFPAMLRDIEQATQRVYLTTYIFQNDSVGNKFIAAFRAAMDRGVDVRVIVDGLGGIAYPPSALRKLKKSGIRFECFDPFTLLPPSLHINLRNHRKILVVDGKTAYAGGQNISDRHLVSRENNRKVARDLHFRFTGKIVDEFERVFLKDWNHACGIIEPEPFKASNINKHQSQIWTRAIPDGPNEDLDKLTELLVGVMSAARKRIWIMTPYFLPSLDLVGGLVAAQLRGVDVKILLPERTNIHLAHWAAFHNLSQILDKDLTVYLQPAPFIHTKAILIDDNYSLVGSANLDPRSLRLNFELVVEVFNQEFAQRIESYFERCLADCTLLDERRLQAIPTWMKIRNAIAWLFSPYL